MAILEMHLIHKAGDARAHIHLGRRFDLTEIFVPFRHGLGERRRNEDRRRPLLRASANHADHRRGKHDRE